MSLLLAVVPAWAVILPESIADYSSDGSGYPGGIPLPPRTLSLTIDDGPAALTLPLAQFLHDHGVRATFFVNGNLIEAMPNGSEVLGQAVALGHRIANHTETHQRWSNDITVGPEEVRLVFQRIAPFLSDGMHLLRVPYGEWSVAMQQELLATGEFDLLMANWKYEINAQDWACFGQGKTSQQCADDYVAQIVARPDQNGGIVLHERVIDEDPTYHQRVIEAIVLGVEALPGTPFVWVPGDAISGMEGGLTAGPAVAWGGFSDAEGFAAPDAAGTLRAGDVDGDGDDDVCARHADGVMCALSDGAALGTPSLWSAGFSDAAGFGGAAEATTFRLGDVDGDGRADACARGAAGWVCELSDGTGFLPSGFVSADFSDFAGFAAAESRYRSIRLGDVDGDGLADVCGRSVDGVHCALSTGSGFAAAARFTAEFDDASGYGGSEYGATLELGDLDGDGLADVCLRGSDGLRCAISTGSGFAASAAWITPGFTDLEGWAARGRFLSIRLGDFDRDGRADVCGRHAAGIVCARSTGAGFVDYHYPVNTNFLDAQGWDAEEHGASLLLANLSGADRLQICGRDDGGLVCHEAAEDADRDGISFERDNCPLQWNPHQDDADDDGTGDWCEPAPASCGSAAGAFGLIVALALPLAARLRQRSRRLG